MFRSTARNLLDWWLDFSEDLLGADLEDYDTVDYHLDHPHRRQLGEQRPRREGTVMPAPAYCVAPAPRRPTRTRTHHLAQ